MNFPSRNKQNTYIVEAPPPTNTQITPSIYSIELRLDQQVDWHWTHFPDGNSVVTGYTITRKQTFSKS